MAKGPRGEKRPADAAVRTVMIGKIATGEIEAERLARRLGTSRSEVYARALAAFAAVHAPNRVTEALDAAVEAAGEDAPDAFSRAAARSVLDRTEW